MQVLVKHSLNKSSRYYVVCKLKHVSMCACLSVCVSLCMCMCVCGLLCCQGFGVAAKSTAECRHVDPMTIVVFHQADIGEYIRNEAALT